MGSISFQSACWSPMTSFPLKVDLEVASELDSPGKKVGGRENHIEFGPGPGPAPQVREFCVLSPLHGDGGKGPHQLLLSPSL